MTERDEHPLGAGDLLPSSGGDRDDGPVGTHLARSAVSAAPAAVDPDAFAGFGEPAVPRPAGEAPELHYTRSARSPLPYLAVAITAIAVAWWAVAWATQDPPASQPAARSDWWSNAVAVLLPSEPSLAGEAFSTFRMWMALGVLCVAALAVSLWIGRLGRNVRTGEGRFGSLVAVLALPAWWLLPYTVGRSDHGASRTDLTIRLLSVVALLLAQFVFLRWALLNRIWRAGHLPYDIASIALWLPNLIPWAMYFASASFTLITMGDDGDSTGSRWRPTEAMADWATATTRFSALALLVLLVVVSVRQHDALRRDRADDLVAGDG